MCAGVDEYTRSAAVLTAYSESDYRSDAAQGKSRGIYQQTPPWWTTWDKGAEDQCRAFLAEFRNVTGNLVVDCWLVQQWLAPDPRENMAGFLAANETKNYLNRLPAISRIITDRKLP